MLDSLPEDLALVNEAMNSDLAGVTVRDLCSAVTTLATFAVAAWVIVKKGWHVTSFFGRALVSSYLFLRPAPDRMGRAALKKLGEGTYSRGSTTESIDCGPGSLCLTRNLTDKNLCVWLAKENVTADCCAVTCKKLHALLDQFSARHDAAVAKQQKAQAEARKKAHMTRILG